MQDPQAHIKQESSKIRIAPPRSAWRRIESQLDSRSAKRRMRTARMLSIAAAVMLIVTIGVTGLYVTSFQKYNSNGLYSLSMEELNESPAEGTSIYDVKKVQELTAITGRK